MPKLALLHLKTPVLDIFLQVSYLGDLLEFRTVLMQNLETSIQYLEASQVGTQLKSIARYYTVPNIFCSTVLLKSATPPN